MSDLKKRLLKLEKEVGGQEHVEVVIDDDGKIFSLFTPKKKATIVVVVRL